MEKKSIKKWSISLGVYPGVLIGVRSYRYSDMSIHVLYLPFVDIAIELFK
jgi:hypothetical protein